MSSEKYNMFRNYMVNELGITRQDIEAWTKQSVATEVSKIVDGINVMDMIDFNIKKVVDRKLDFNTRYGDNEQLIKHVAIEISKSIELKLK